MNRRELLDAFRRARRTRSVVRVGSYQVWTTETTPRLRPINWKYATYTDYWAHRDGEKHKIGGWTTQASAVFFVLSHERKIQEDAL